MVLAIGQGHHITGGIVGKAVGDGIARARRPDLVGLATGIAMALWINEIPNSPMAETALPSLRVKAVS